MGTYHHILVVVSFVSICLDKENLKLIAFDSLDLAGLTFSPFVPIITYENSSFPVSAGTNYAFISQDLFKKTVSNITFLNCP